jgi:hypothetical protein
VSRLRTGLRSAIAWSPALAVIAGISIGILTTPGKTAPDPTLVHAVSDVGAPALGAADAPVTLTVYLNYRLPRSATLWAELGPLLDEFPGTMRILFKQIDGRGEVGHAILEARAQGKFPEMHAGLLELCEEIDQDRIFDLARVVGLDMERFEATLEGLLHDDEIDRGLEEFFAIENRRLPLLLVNGRRYIFARNQEAMRRRMAEELRWLEGGPPPMELSLGMQIGARIGDLTDRAERFWRPLGLAALILMVSGAAWLVWKGRGLQDWIAGTYVVPR